MNFRFGIWDLGFGGRLSSAFRFLLSAFSLSAILAALAAAETAQACNFGTCRTCQRKFVQQVYVPQAVNYFVGAPIRIEALVQKELRDNPLYQEFLQFKAWQEANGGRTAEGGAESPSPATGALQQNCGRCHGGATPKAQLILDGSAPLAASTITRALRMIASGRMPPKQAGALTREQKGAVMQELLDLETTADNTPKGP